MKKLLFFFCLIFLISCMSTGHKHKHHYKEKVHCYKVHKSNVDTDDTWIYYYIILMNNNSYYYTTSSSSISDFSKSTWTQAKENPMDEINGEEELPKQELSSEELPEEIQGQMEANPEEFNEATPETEVDATESETSTDASDAEGGDGGDTGDSGGGDSGGGDGGGE